MGPLSAPLLGFCPPLRSYYVLLFLDQTVILQRDKTLFPPRHSLKRVSRMDQLYTDCLQLTASLSRLWGSIWDGPTGLFPCYLLLSGGDAAFGLAARLLNAFCYASSPPDPENQGDVAVMSGAGGSLSLKIKNNPPKAGDEPKGKGSFFSAQTSPTSLSGAAEQPAAARMLTGVRTQLSHPSRLPLCSPPR